MPQINNNNQMVGKTFYIMENQQSKVLEIRRKVKMNGQTRYVIDRMRGDVKFVSPMEFYHIGDEYRLVKIN